MSVQLIDDLVDKPWNHGFFSLLRRLNANPAIDLVGTALRPQNETFRVGQKPTLIFAPSEVAEASVKDGKVHMRIYSQGMLGPNGPLPIHITEIAREREELRGDTTLSSFLDIFHHRSLTILFRAWANAQAVVSLDRPDRDHFSFMFGCMTGVSPRRDRTVALPAHARLAASPLLLNERRNSSGLCQWIGHHFDVPVEMEEPRMYWVELPPELQCRSGEEHMTLGGGAMLGEYVPCMTQRLCLILGPLDIDTYHRFTPRGEDLLRLVAMVRAYLGLEFGWELELRIKPNQATPVELGDNQQLGWTSWLGESPNDEPVVGMRFEPELYVDQLVRNMKKEP
ncbi:type VI secretion system baseplate subunit TssG [Paraburkholderia sp. J67]|uniref:type VI secretion system baseplate subunit TssG n=1 Tax=Paraburkholderia sp. J67 TaxID=2805435 RepID=UPI002ABE2318|nr:type VI secretion system baseplate subunit TssG [Paraburkholderia sp. J67]